MTQKHVWGFLVCAVLLTAQKQAPPKVVFVCEHGAAKSVIAAAEFERMAKERGLNIKAVARGTNPDPQVPAVVRQGLKADGMKPGVAKPVKVSSSDLDGATKVISFGPDLSSVHPQGAKAQDWSAAPSPGADYKAARDFIRKKLEALLGELQSDSRKK